MQECLGSSSALSVWMCFCRKTRPSWLLTPMALAIPCMGKRVPLCFGMHPVQQEK